MKKFLKIKSEIFGLDINDLSLKIIKLKENKGGFVLSSINEVEIKPGIVEGGVIKNEDALVEIIKQACKSVKGESLGTKYVVASLPEERSFFQVIKMPKMEEKELKLAAMFEVENYIPLSIDNIYVDFQKINDTDVLIVAMPKLIVDSYVSCFEKAGLVPYILEVESQAIVRSLVKTGTTAPLAIIDLGKNNASLIIFSGNSISFTSSINVDIKQIDKDISGATLEELFTQIEKYLDFYLEHFFHEHLPTDGKVEKIILCGGGSSLKALPEFLSKKLNIPVEIASLPKDVLVKNNSVGEVFKKFTSFMTALGLAERGAIEGKEYPHI